MPPLPVPHQFSKSLYVLEELPRGASGTVYRARYTPDNSMVVIKFFDHHITHALFSYFSNEQLLLREIGNHRQHEHIVKYVTHNFAREPFFLVTRYVEGARNVESIVGVPLPPGLVLRVSEQIGDALDYVHWGHPQYQPIIHRDVKPGNILLDARGNAVLIDFSIARHPHFTLEEEKGLGSLPYMPPEQYRGEEVGNTDQFALAAVVFHMLVGVPLLPNNRSAYKKLEHLRDTQYAEVAKRLGDARTHTAAVLIKALAFEPADRYETCGAFAAALRKAFADDGLSIAVATLPEPSFLRKHGAMLIIVAVMLLAVLFPVAVILSRQPDTGVTPATDAPPSVVPTSTLWPTPTMVQPSGNPGVSNDPGLGPTSTLVPATPTRTPTPVPSRVVVNAGDPEAGLEILRLSPETTARNVGEMYPGARAIFLGQSRVVQGVLWHKVRFNGDDGWCRAQYCVLQP